MSYFIPQRYNESYNQNAKKTTFFVWWPHPIYPHKLQLHCLGSATQPPPEHVRDELPRVAWVIKPPVPLDKPPSFEAKRAESIAWNETKQKTGCRWLVSKGKELGRVGWVWLGWVFFETTKLYIVDQLTPSNKNWHGSLRNSGPPKKKRRFPVWGMLIFRGFFKRSNPQQNATHLCPLDLNGLKIPPKKRPVKSWATKKKWQIK